MGEEIDSGAVASVFRLDGNSDWLKDPRSEAPRVLKDTVDAALLVARAQAAASAAKVDFEVWYATSQVAVCSSRPKWAAWRVDAEVQADPKYKAYKAEMARTAGELEVANAVALAVRRKAWFIGALYNIDIPGM